MIRLTKRRSLLLASVLTLTLGIFAIAGGDNRPNTTPVEKAYRWFDIAPSGTFKNIACHSAHADKQRALVLCTFRVTDYWSGFSPNDYGWSFSFRWRHGHWDLTNYGAG